MARRLHLPSAANTRAGIVEHQLATAISIGILQRGERLPSESVMAQIFGVSAITFRQSLDRLRQRGLVSTRAGRGGGTVIDPSRSALRQLSMDSLAEASLMDIMDAGTMLSGLLMQSARAAAERCDHFDHAALRELSRDLEQARDPLQRGRAATMLLVSLASATRSELLFQAVVPAISRIQAWLWFEEGESPYSTKDAIDMVQAVEDSCTEAAMTAADRQVRYLTTALLRRRLAIYTDQGLPDRDGDSGLRALVARLHAIEKGLEHAASLAASLPDGGQITPDVFELLKEVVHMGKGLARGAGIAYAPGTAMQSRLWMDWWDAGHSKELAFKPHTFSVGSMQYYDYTRMPWFTNPRAEPRFHLHGPYVDRGGIEQVTITVSLPVESGPFQGSVVGADLVLTEIERLLLTDAEHASSPWALVTDLDRIVVSSIPEWWPGSLLPQDGATEATPGAPKALGRHGWRLMTRV